MKKKKSPLLTGCSGGWEEVCVGVFSLGFVHVWECQDTQEALKKRIGILRGKFGEREKKGGGIKTKREELEGCCTPRFGCTYDVITTDARIWCQTHVTIAGEGQTQKGGKWQTSFV